MNEAIIIITVIIFIIIIVLASALATLDNEELDEICNQDNSILYRSAGAWACSSVNVSASGSTSWNDLTDMPAGFADNIDDTGNTTGLINGSFINSSGIELGDRTTGDSPCIYFNDDTYHDESLCWNDGNDRFQLTDDIYSSTDIIASSKMQSTYYVGQYINLVRFSNSPYISFSDIGSETDYYIYNINGDLTFKDTDLNNIFVFDNALVGSLNTASFYSHVYAKGNATINLFYGELFYHNRTGTTLNFAVQNQFYPLWFNNFTSNGITYKIGGKQTIANLSVSANGAYKVSYSASGDGQNNHVYITSIFVNEDNQENCENMKKMTAGGDITTQTKTCIIDLLTSDKVTLRVADITGTGTGNYYNGNLNVFRVGT